MAKILGIKGVTASEYRGSWKLRWRETHATPDGPKRVARSYNVSSEEEVAPIATEIRKALDERGYWDPPTESARPMAVDLEALSAEWMTRRVGRRGLADNTRRDIKGALKRWWRAMREVERIPATQSIPARHMNPDTVEQTVARLMEKHAQTTAYQTAHRAIEGFWVWATDRGIPDLQPAPRDLSELMPRAPAHAPPTDTATWAEMDACIGRIIGKRPEVVQSNVVAAYWSAVIQRYTGIRQFQAVGILREECDTEGNTLLIRRGKSPGEKALNRRVAVSKHLFQDLTPLLDAVASGPLFPDRRHPDEPIRSYRNTTRYIRRGWELATDDGNARKTVWLQPNKNKPNITQAFRGGFQHGLEEAGVRDSTISFLVGHAAQSTRQRHYTRPSMDMMWRAVQHIPKIAEPSAR